MTNDIATLTSLLSRIADALERAAPPATVAPDFEAADAFVWATQPSRFEPVPRVNRVEMDLLQGIDRVRDQLVENTERFARGLAANNALLWGARGMGKSSLVKAAHAHVNRSITDPAAPRLKLVEIHREDIETLPALMAHARAARHRFIVFCDDLSFDADDTSYKSLKAVLEGGIEGRPDNVYLLCHLQPPAPAAARHDGERALHCHQSRRGSGREGLALGPLRLWLGFHKCSQDEYLAMVEGYVAHHGLPSRKPTGVRRRWNGPPRAAPAPAARLAVRAGSGRPARRAAEGRVNAVSSL